MTRAEQRKLFMEFYGVTPELKRWAADKWKSGTASVTPESITYMQREIDARISKAEHEAKIAKLIEEENADNKRRSRPAKADKHPKARKSKLASKLQRAGARNGGKPIADTPIEAFCGAATGEGSSSRGETAGTQREDSGEAQRADHIEVKQTEPVRTITYPEKGLGGAGDS